jgi:hypothetical protein
VTDRKREQVGIRDLARAQNACNSVAVAVAPARRSRIVRTGGAFGYAGWHMMRMQPFCMIGQEAQPWGAYSLNHAIAGACRE